MLSYYSKVTRAEVEALGAYLVRNGHFNGERRRVQPTGDGKSFQIRYVVRKGAENDPATFDAFRVAAADMCRELFGNR